MYFMEPNQNSVFYYILIVDDEKNDHFFIRRAIDHLIPQAIVESLYDGSEALEYLDHCSAMPNLIILDLKMREISGRDTISIIRKNEALSKVPVVIFTNSKDHSEKEELLAMGAEGFYTKPSEMNDLNLIIEEVRDKWLYQFH